MQPTTTLWTFSIPPGRCPAFAPLAFALIACATTPDPCPAAPPYTPVSLAGDTISFGSSAGTSARVTRAVAPDGSETLHGETELSLRTGTRRCIVEDVRLDARGRLVEADVTTAASCGAAPETRSHLDPAAGVARVTTQTGDDAAACLRISGVSGGAAPPAASWIYTPEVLPGRAVTTPVAAWVAVRAAATSPSLLLVELELQQAWQVPRDQVVVTTEIGSTVVLGNDGADVGAGFVEGIRMADYGVTLVRVPRSGEPAI